MQRASDKMIWQMSLFAAHNLLTLAVAWGLHHTGYGSLEQAARCPRSRGPKKHCQLVWPHDYIDPPPGRVLHLATRTPAQPLDACAG